MPVIKKVQSKVSLPKQETPKEEKVPVKKAGASAVSREEDSKKSQVRSKKVCHFCRSKTEPRYWDVVTLRKSISDRVRIYPRSRTGACAKHQRRLSKEIKHARIMALLPFKPSL